MRDFSQADRRSLFHDNAVHFYTSQGSERGGAWIPAEALNTPHAFAVPRALPRHPIRAVRPARRSRPGAYRPMEA